MFLCYHMLCYLHWATRSNMQKMASYIKCPLEHSVASVSRCPCPSDPNCRYPSMAVTLHNVTS